jgi:hypothetical protein
VAASSLEPFERQRDEEVREQSTGRLEGDGVLERTAVIEEWDNGPNMMLVEA